MMQIGWGSPSFISYVEELEDRTVMAYAFLLYRRDKMLREVAEKRLSAIREFTDLALV